MKKYNFHSPFYKETTIRLYDYYCHNIINKISSFSENETKNKINLILEKIKGKRFSNILVYGQVQSGKTMFFTTLIFSLIDKYINPSIVILCDNNSKLMDQTYSRIQNDINKISSTKDIALYKFEEYKNLITEEQATKSIPRIYFCLKQKDHLDNLKRIFTKSEFNKNLVIIDDESDVASVSCEKGTINKSITTMIDTAINKGWIVNYFPITATPYDNCSVDFNTKLKPNIIIALNSDAGYFGLQKFHSILNNPESNNIINISNNDISLNDCISDFSANILCQYKNKKHLTLLINNEIVNEKQNELCDYIKKKLKNEEIIVSPLNATGKSKIFGEYLSIDDNNIYNSQIIVGCNKVSRGVTFKNLDYMFLDGSNNISISTLLQRARWFGYRKNIDNLKIYLPEIYQNYFIEIADLAMLQNHILKNKIILNPYAYNILRHNFRNFKNLIYSNYQIKDNNKFKIMWYDDAWKEYDNDFKKIINILKEYPCEKINNNLVFKFKNINAFGNNIDIITKIINDKSSYIINDKNKSIIIRCIDCNKNYKFKSNIRKILKFDNKECISVHNYNDEYNDKFFNSIVIDLIKFKSWKIKNNNKNIKNNYNYKIIVQDLSLIDKYLY